MRLNNRFLLIVLTSSVVASAQCTRPELTPRWNADKGQFTCVSMPDSKGTVSEQAVLPTGDKAYCSSARENLLKVCPSSTEGKACRSEAKAIFNGCYKAVRESPPDSGPGRTNKTDPAVCMNNFTQQQQACASRKVPASSPGPQSVSDTCLQDALAAQSRCLQNSH